MMGGMARKILVDDSGEPRELAVKVASEALARIDVAWSRAATSCRVEQPCYSCTTRGSAVVRALAAIGEDQ